jgi:hypothetical protein
VADGLSLSHGGLAKVPIPRFEIGLSLAKGVANVRAALRNFGLSERSKRPKPKTNPTCGTALDFPRHYPFFAPQIPARAKVRSARNGCVTIVRPHCAQGKFLAICKTLDKALL